MKLVNADLLRPWTRFLKISVVGRTVQVPDNNTLLRGLQSVAPDGISRGRFCWNNECGNCRVYYRLPGDAADRKARGCCLVATDEMALTDLSTELKFALREVLKREPDAPLPEAPAPEPEEDPMPVPTFRGDRGERP
ncbi:MAG: hypothetical protein MUE47_02320 [Acidobacteria bacterium]|nr:hypothetical protein [Acidobacteriota bacterium]